MKKLYRNRKDRILAGVCGGLGHYFGYDPILVRLLFALLVILTGVVPGALIYIIAMMIVPEEPTG